MDPELDHNLVELGIIQGVEIDDDSVEVEIQLTSPHCPFARQIVERIERAVKGVEGVGAVEVRWHCTGEA
jgi:metal-sulfur cluster biosynthetic enzyme